MTTKPEALSDFSCGNGCVFGPSGKGGMQTNGGCVCTDRKLQRGVLHLRQENAHWQAIAQHRLEACVRGTEVTDGLREENVRLSHELELARITIASYAAIDTPQALLDTQETCRKQAETLKEYADVAYAVGIAHVADGHAVVPGPVELIVAEVKRLQRKETGLAETIARLREELALAKQDAEGWRCSHQEALKTIETMDAGRTELTSTLKTLDKELAAKGFNGRSTVRAALREALKEST